MVGQLAGDAEERLAELEQASQALLAELSALELEVTMERTCRQCAEAYAARVKQENKELKRLSLAPTAPPEEPPLEDPDPAQCYREQLHDLQQKLSWLLEQRKDLTTQVQELQRQNQDLQDQLEQGQEEQQCLRAALATTQRTLRSFKRVSQILTQDYCEAMEQLELEQDLRRSAEAFAHEMLVQKKEAQRQSTLLLQGGGPSTQLLAALQEVGRLSRALEETRLEQQQRVKELQEQLGMRPELEELEVAQAALAMAEEEKVQLKERLQEAERRLLGLQEEVGSLQEKLTQDSPGTPAPAVPPPPPPPPPLPPPTPAVPTDPLAAIRQRKGLANAQRTKPGAEDVKARAVQEMMERIRNGVVLRPTKELPQPGQDTAGKRRSAVLELRSILGAVRRRGSRGPSRRSGRDRQLETILQRRRRALDPPEPPQPDPWEPQPGDKDKDKDKDTAPSGRPPGTGEGVPFRPRVGSGLPRSRPLARLATGTGERV
ncbi:shootin-1-like [Aegotheles albertisi]